MTVTGLDTFDRTLQESNEWLKSLMEYLHTDSRHLAYVVLRASFHALRDRVGPENAVHLGAQLPMLLRGLFFEGWRMAGTPSKERTQPQFLDHVRKELPPNLAQDAERAVRAAFSVIYEKIDTGEVAKVIGVLPEGLRDLWPSVARAS